VLTPICRRAPSDGGHSDASDIEKRNGTMNPLPAKGCHPTRRYSDGNAAECHPREWAGGRGALAGCLTWESALSFEGGRWRRVDRVGTGASDLLWEDDWEMHTTEARGGRAGGSESRRHPTG